MSKKIGSEKHSVEVDKGCFNEPQLPLIKALVKRNTMSNSTMTI